MPGQSQGPEGAWRGEAMDGPTRMSPARIWLAVFYLLNVLEKPWPLAEASWVADPGPPPLCFPENGEFFPVFR